ncbi:Flp pilus assembly complex ATPase component TadA [Kitasatospora sp. RB6PN24]|uniref:CpaF family protein n=1 Tax=Kitasatospora humi TaxID=2893891 RepID=UPI001E65256A|nr:ATPase, T2SS/T4P/T4SS family [Kitasatospora humi]MCC9309954.1 Flp pilus assembly complex ATPase component TadA [Kitasatospora humi]
MAPLDTQLVRRLREQAGVRLAQQRRQDEESGIPPMRLEDERQFARSVIAGALAEHVEDEARQGRLLPTPDEERDLVEAVHAALYGAGPLQPLLEDPQIENININGDRTFVRYAGGRKVRLGPLVGSDEELYTLVQTLAATSGLSSRAWDSLNAELDLTLPDGSRLSAVRDVSKRPALSIRRNRIGKVRLDALVENGTVPPDVAAFLRAAVLAKKNIIIAGATDSGKTTLLRALANEIHPDERLITIERSLELGLDEFEDLHPDIVVMEERLANSEGEGAVTMADLVRRSLRQDPDRVIVGEVLGGEIVTMLQAMSQGNDGSLSTIHARDSSEVWNRIATYALTAKERLPIEASHMLIAGSVHFVAFLKKVRDPHTGEKVRRLMSIREVNGFDQRVQSSEVFKMAPHGVLMPAAQLTCLDELADFGYLPGGGWL